MSTVWKVTLAVLATLPPTGWAEDAGQVEAAPAPTSATEDAGRPFSQEDLAPFFREGLLARAKAELDQGRPERARGLLQQAWEGGPPPPQVRYLAALAALRASDFAYAASEMTELAEAYPPMRERCLTHAGLAQEELGHYQQAAALFEQLPESSRLYPDARLGLFRVLRKHRQTEAAALALEKLAARPAPPWGRDVSAEALLALADLWRDRKDARGEKEALRRLWSLHPLSPLAAQAEKRLGGPAKLSPEAQVARGEILVEAHRNRQGIALIEPLLPGLELPDPLACRAHFARGKGLRKERRHSEAIRALSPVVEKCQEPDLRARAMYVLASSQSISDLSRAAQTYEALAAEQEEHSFADDALFYAADVYAKRGEPESALKRLAELVERYPEGDFFAEALFKASWIHRAAGRPEEQLALLARIEARYTDAEESYELERARYWRARALEGLEKKEEAAGLLEQLALDHPATYYGLLAHERLGRLDPERARAVAGKQVFARSEQGPWPIYAGPLGDYPRFATGVELLRLGFPEAASAELLAIERAPLPPESVRLLVQVLSAAGDQRGAHAVARVSLRKELSGRVTGQTRPAWEIAYPNAFRELIEKHCKQHGLEPDLLQALMREESALDPKALSWAGALGLTQLMPATARLMAQKLKLGRVTTEQLLEPELNIRLGAAYLGKLHQRYRGSKQLMLAGYNAGEGAVDRWRGARPEAELDEWVEEIPIAETRGYVKRVLRSYNTYRLLYGGGERAPAEKPKVVEQAEIKG